MASALSYVPVKAHRSPVWIPSHAPCLFPDPRDFDSRGLIAGGGDLSAKRLLRAYRAGIFPWYDEPPILWWSPDPRAIVSPDSLHISRSLRRRFKQRSFVVTRNQAPLEVMNGCADRAGGTWLTAEMRRAYLELFEQGHLLSYEVWTESAHIADRTLVGGLYGVLVGGLFAAESKFHRETDASKVALVCAVHDTFAAGARLFDVQFLTDHLKTMGVLEVSRDAYLDSLARVQDIEVAWTDAGGDLVPWVFERLAAHSGS